MEKLLTDLPDEQRRSILNELKSRQEARLEKLASDEERARERLAASAGSAAALAKKISDLRVESISQQFEDQVRTLVRLVKEHKPERIGELRDELLSEKIVDPLIFPDAIEKFTDSRLHTFEKHLRET